MAAYRKKPVQVEAEKYEGEALVEGNSVHDLLQRSGAQWGVSLVHDLLVTTVDGNEVRVPVGAYVVIDGKGYPYPCDAEIFEAGHEPIDPQTPWSFRPDYDEEAFERGAGLGN